MTFVPKRIQKLNNKAFTEPGTHIFLQVFKKKILLLFYRDQGKTTLSHSNCDLIRLILELKIKNDGIEGEA